MQAAVIYRADGVILAVQPKTHRTREENAELTDSRVSSVFSSLCTSDFEPGSH